MNPLNLLRRSRRSAPAQRAHMTWASRSLSQTVSRTGVFLKKQLWIWPIVAVLLLLVIGLVVRSAIASTMRNNLASELQTLLDVETAMLETWFETQVSNAETLANDLQIRESVYQLLERDSGLAEALPQAANTHVELQTKLADFRPRLLQLGLEFLDPALRGHLGHLSTSLPAGHTSLLAGN